LRLARTGRLAHFSPVTIRATVHNHRIELPPELAVAEGAEVEIILSEEKRGKTLAERLAPFIGAVHSGVGDLADNHDHHLYGAPKHKP
jgi:hypothetical protein